MFALADLAGSRIAFYATVATVLPVIMLAFGFQLQARDILVGRVARVRRSARPLVYFLAVVVVAVMAREWAAIFALAYKENGSYTLVRVAAFVGGAVLLLGTANQVSTQIRKGFADEDRGGDSVLGS